MKAFYIITFISLLTSCANTLPKIMTKKIDNKVYTSILKYQVKGDGISDDTKNIQTAFVKEKNLYFPKGQYRIASSYYGLHNWQSLSITNEHKVRNIVFEKGAKLVITDDFHYNHSRSAILKIETLSGSIDSISIKGLTIEFEKLNYSKKHTAIYANEYNGYNINNFILINTTIYNSPEQGIATSALSTEIYNAKTYDSAMHGIVAFNYYNHNQPHKLYISNYTSENDKGYSINFSGKENKNDSKKAFDSEIWTGIVKNIYSKNSKYGIKTSGYWDLNMENVIIENSENNGFFINKDAPQMRIYLRDCTIINCKNAGLNLHGNTQFEGENIKIENCKTGIIVDRAKVRLKQLEVIGGNKTKGGLLIKNSCDIDDFKLIGINSDYSIRIDSKYAELKNGYIESDAKKMVWIKEETKHVELLNIDIVSNVANNKNIIVSQKSGHFSAKNIKVNNKKVDVIDKRTNINIIQK